MSAGLTKDDLLAVWRRDMDPGYTEPLEVENSGRGLDPISGLAAVLARASTAVLTSTQALFLKPHSSQLAPPASGAVVATGQVEIFRGIVVGGPLPLDDGDQIIAQFFGVNGEDEDAPVFEVVGDVTIPSGSEGPTLVDVRCSRPGFQGNVPPGTEGKFPDKRGGTFAVTSFNSGTDLLTVDIANGDRLLPTMNGMLWRFTSGPNRGAFARRLFVSSPTTAQIDHADSSLVTQGAGTGEVVDFQTVLDARIVFRDGTINGRSAELDMLARERTEIGRAVGESDEDFRGRVAVLPESVTPNALIRAIQVVLEPLGIPFQFIEVFEQDVGFFFDDGSHVVDSAFSDPFAYRERTFYVGGLGAGPGSIGFIVVINGLLLPPEPGLTAVLSALTTTIIGSKGAGVPWAVAIEPPVP
jgi:hypothetical protein